MKNAEMRLAANKRVVVHMGDDQANDYIYKFVSDGVFDANRGLANGNLLDAGKLYVANSTPARPAATSWSVGNGCCSTRRPTPRWRQTPASPPRPKS